MIMVWAFDKLVNSRLYPFTFIHTYLHVHTNVPTVYRAYIGVFKHLKLFVQSENFDMKLLLSSQTIINQNLILLQTAKQ